MPGRSVTDGGAAQIHCPAAGRGQDAYDAPISAGRKKRGSLRKLRTRSDEVEVARANWLRMPFEPSAALVRLDIRVGQRGRMLNRRPHLKRTETSHESNFRCYRHRFGH